MNARDFYLGRALGVQIAEQTVNLDVVHLECWSTVGQFRRQVNRDHRLELTCQERIVQVGERVVDTFGQELAYSQRIPVVRVHNSEHIVRVRTEQRV